MSRSLHEIASVSISGRSQVPDEMSSSGINFSVFSIPWQPASTSIHQFQRLLTSKPIIHRQLSCEGDVHSDKLGG